MNLEKPISGVFFDLGWTILRPATGDWQITSKVLEYVDSRILSSIPKEKLNEAKLEASQYLDNDLMLTEADELVAWTHYYRTFAEMLPKINITKEQADKIAYDRVYNDSNYVFFDDARMTIERLKEKYKVGVISDTEPSINRVLKNAGFYDYFDNLTLSYELGVTKPNPKMFEHALDVMELPAEETLFIDDLELNLNGAANAGIQPILICSKPDSPESTKYLNIKKISELLLYL